MAFASNSTHTSNSIQEEYNYHIEQAVYHKEQADKSALEARRHLLKLDEHLFHLQISNKIFNS